MLRFHCNESRDRDKVWTGERFDCCFLIVLVVNVESGETLLNHKPEAFTKVQEYLYNYELNRPPSDRRDMCIDAMSWLEDNNYVNLLVAFYGKVLFFSTKAFFAYFTCLVRCSC